MKRRRIQFVFNVVLLFITTVSLQAEENPFSASLSTSTSRAGSITAGQIDWWWAKDTGSSLTVEVQSGRDFGEFSGQSGSLKVTEQWEARIGGAAWKRRFNGIAAGAGIHAFLADVRERGNFLATINGSPETQQFDNRYAAQLFGPGLFFEVPPTGGVVSFSGNFTVAPMFVYRFTQKVTLQPLVTEEGERTYWDVGAPLISAEFGVGAWDALTGTVFAEYEHLPFEKLVLTTDPAGFSFNPKKSNISNFALRPELTAVIPVTGAYGIAIGGAVEISWVYTHDLSQREQSDPVWYLTARVSGE
jgi:hypothetical protein